MAEVGGLRACFAGIMEVRKHYVWNYGSKDLWNYGKVKNDDVSKGCEVFMQKKWLV